MPKTNEPAAAVAMIDQVIQKLEADLAALRTAREVLGRAAPPTYITGAEYRAKHAPDEPTPARAAAAPAAFGRDRAGTTAKYAALVPHADRLEPKTCRAVKLRGGGTMPAEIAKQMKITVKEVQNMLQRGAWQLPYIAGRQASAAPSPRAPADTDDEPEPVVVEEDRDDVPAILKTAAPGVNELLELRLEKIRGAAPSVRPPWATVGAIVVGRKDDQDECLFRVLAHLPNEMTRVERCNRSTKKIGRRSFLLVPGELVRLADARKTNRGLVSYFVHSEAAS